MIVGKHTYGQDNITTFWEGGPPACAQLKIGSFCAIAGRVKIYLGGNHRADWISTYPFGHINQSTFGSFNGVGHPKTNGDVVIGNDVWIGADVTIMSGIKIGDGAIIASNSHIVQNVKPYSVVGGNPGKFYYYRFEEDVIKKLLELKWWDLEDTIINEISPILCSGDFENLFSFFDKR